MTKTHFLESADLLTVDAEKDTWTVRLINAGRGSSGVYSEALLESYHHAFDGALSFENHPTTPTGPQARNFTQIVGRVVGETWLDRDENNILGVYGEYKPDKNHRERLMEYKDQLGLSIFIAGEGRAEESTGDFIVESFDAQDPYRSVDVVIAAGRGGRFEESLKKMYGDRVGESLDKPGANTSAQEHRKKEQGMEEADQKRLDALLTAVEALVSASQAKTEQVAQVEADSKAVAAAVESFAAQSAAIDAAELLPSQVEALRAEAKKGTDVAPLIESAKKIRDEVKAAVVAESKTQGFTATGRILGENDDWAPSGFGGSK